MVNYMKISIENVSARNLIRRTLLKNGVPENELENNSGLLGGMNLVISDKYYQEHRDKVDDALEEADKLLKKAEEE